MNNKRNFTTEQKDKSASRKMATFSDEAKVTHPTEKVVVTPFEKNKILAMYPLAKKKF